MHGQAVRSCSLAGTEESIMHTSEGTSPDIGIMFRREQDPATLMAWAQRVEEMGFDQLWVVEDCFYLGGIAQAAMALAATGRLKVGMGINPAVARNPAFLAMEYATLASAFPGRFIGGIGHGVAEWMDQVGARPASWLKSIDEITTTVRRILRGERVDFEGTYVRLSGVQLESAPSPVPPVLLGVRGDKSLRLAGSCADGLLLAELSGPAYIQWARKLMAEGRADAGRDGEGQVIVFVPCQVDDLSPAAARQKMGEVIAGMNAGGLQPQVTRLPFALEMNEMMARGTLVDEMPDEWMHELAIAGTHDDARKSVSRFAEAGANAVVLVPPEDVDWDSWLTAQAWAVASH
jgi:5,10-methylenetetrahydromethanopterin reductase